MNTMTKYGAIAVLQGAALLTVAGGANALPIDGTVEESRSDGYSVVHLGSNPGGQGNQNDWLWFDAGQSLNFDLTGGMVSLLGTQSFNLSSNNGASSVLDITALNLDLNDPADGFIGGTLDYVLDGTTTGTFSFFNDNHNALYNSSSFDGTNIEFYIWGGDAQNSLGIDLGVSGVVASPDPDPVPVPGSLALAGLGLMGLWRSRRSSRSTRA
ncbi:MAG: PEP-CTERM sorting domain-containing protein [Halioglobus sp.]